MEIWKNNKIDDRDREDIMKQIGSLAASYAPEWRFHTHNPDAGSVIGIIFAEQIFHNISRLNMLPDIYHAEFVNMYGISPRAPKAAESVAVIDWEGRRQGMTVSSGTQLVAGDARGEDAIFETTQDVYVTGTRLKEVLAVSGKRDKLILMMNVLAEKKNAPVPLFTYKEKGMEPQTLYLYHPYMFVTQNNTIVLRFHGENRTLQESEQLAALFANQEQFTFFYEENQKLCPFNTVTLQGDRVVLTTDTPKPKEDAEQGIQTIALRLLTAVDSSVKLSEIELVTEEQAEQPDFVLQGTAEMEVDNFRPFGEQLAIYQECYIGHRQIFGQKGMMACLEFELDFEEYCPSDNRIPETNLKLIKRKPIVNHEAGYYACYAQEVSLEYFNGKGWKKLQCDVDMTTLFGNCENAGEYRVHFQIPDDWERTVQGGYEQECLRLQVIRADNCYLHEVRFYYPVIRNLIIRTRVQDDKRLHPERVRRTAGVREEDVSDALYQRSAVTVFSNSRYDGEYMLFGFDNGFEQGPVGLFFELQDELYGQRPKIAYEYSSISGFKPLKVVDYTGNLEHSGRIVFMPPSDMSMCEIGGRKRYWIRMRDVEDFFSQHEVSVPVLKHLHMNAVGIRNVETGNEREYYLEQVTPDMSFPLHTNHILSAEVWVNETNQLSQSEKQKLQEQMPDSVMTERNYMGEQDAFYVLWNEVETFDAVQGKQRCYVIDRSRNMIFFGDGVRTAIPRNTNGVAFKVRIVRCDGGRGNIRADAIKNARGRLTGISGIHNPIAAYGGDDIESSEWAFMRGSHILGGRRRLVSEADYIREALLYSSSIDKVACISELGGAERKSLLRIVLLMKDYARGSYAFRNVSGGLKQHLLTSCEMAYGEQEVQIVEPVFVKISIMIWLEAKDISQSIEIKQRWLRRISRYLEPVSMPEGEGWRIGRLPDEKQIRLMLSAMEKEAYVCNLAVAASYQDGKGMHETGLAQLEATPEMICCNGEHRIYVSERGKYAEHRNN